MCREPSDSHIERGAGNLITLAAYGRARPDPDRCGLLRVRSVAGSSLLADDWFDGSVLRDGCQGQEQGQSQRRRESPRRRGRAREGTGAGFVATWSGVRFSLALTISITDHRSRSPISITDRPRPHGAKSAFFQSGRGRPRSLSAAPARRSLAPRTSLSSLKKKRFSRWREHGSYRRQRPSNFAPRIDVRAPTFSLVMLDPVVGYSTIRTKILLEYTISQANDSPGLWQDNEF